jgi:hypothetical protein
MAQTGIRIQTDIQDVYQRIIIETETNKIKDEHILEVMVTHCDQDWTPKGESLKYVRTETEEDFHVGLRRESAKKEQLITQFSTDPQWNPKDYVLLDDQFDTKDATEDVESFKTDEEDEL